MVDNTLDLALLLQVSDGNSRQRTVHFQPLDEDRLADEFEGGHFLENTVIGWLVEGDGVLCLVFYFSLRPLLLLCGLAA